MTSGDNYDVLKFRAKRAVRILGQGGFGPVASKDSLNWSFGIKYHFNGQDSPVGEFKPEKDMKDEFQCYPILYDKIGLQSFEVPAGGEFLLFQKMIKTQGICHAFGSNGKPDAYNKIQGNSPDFEVMTVVNYKNNSTNAKQGQFPYLIYEYI